MEFVRISQYWLFATIFENTRRGCAKIGVTYFDTASCLMFGLWFICRNRNSHI